jgi:hypothetical protein
MTFRGGANGDEAPIRIIQGPLTRLYNYGDTLAIDPVHNEIFYAAGYPKNHVLVFNREANGNVAPIRVLQGPETQIGGISLAGLAVDPVNNLLVVLGQIAGGGNGILVFDRTANGNVKPKRVITGGAQGKVFVYPPRNEIIVVGSRRAGSDGRAMSEEGAQNESESAGFVSVWNINDDGNTPPREWKLELPRSMQGETEGYGFGSIMGAGIDTKNKAILVANKTFNAILTYAFPEIF